MLILPSLKLVSFQNASVLFRVCEYKYSNIRVPQHVHRGRTICRSLFFRLDGGCPYRESRWPNFYDSQLSQRSGFTGVSTATQSFTSKAGLKRSTSARSEQFPAPILVSLGCPYPWSKSLSFYFHACPGPS